MLNMADVPAGVDFVAKGIQAVLVMCSTQGDGVPPSEVRRPSPPRLFPLLPSARPQRRPAHRPLRHLTRLPPLPPGA